ncbi:hypothetical protein NLU13_4790 [Sarocladium strictum]|uniref:Pectinesterase n=1 Tax=Sarocladium strictum TaxID=5046 RepID=A0AA39L902_SARSR|nr:hypothetical protein NLU13_4790 [Sarocladium strictum]
MKFSGSALLLLASGVLGASRTKAPSGCLTVSPNGPYRTVQSAVNALPTNSASEQCIFVDRGTYNEQVLVPARSAPRFTIYGHTTDDRSPAANGATIVFGLSQMDGLNNDGTATLRVKADGFRLYNVNVRNSYGEGSQAVAVSAYASSGYYGCSFGRQIYVDTQIVGATDFIFGQRASSWFERADIRVLAKSLGYVTANGRDSDGNPSYYVFDHSRISAANGNSVPSGAYYLGRPWRSYSRVVFQRTDMTSVVHPAGWRIWNADQPNTSNVYYGEYRNTGPGSQGSRASFSRKLGSPVAIETVLGSDYKAQKWYDASYFAGNGADVGSS